MKKNIKEKLEKAKKVTAEFILSHPLEIIEAGLLVGYGTTMFKFGSKVGFKKGEKHGFNMVLSEIVNSSDKGIFIFDHTNKRWYLFTATPKEPTV